MKVSDITISNVVDYLKLNSGEYTESEIQIYLNASIAYVKAYTGLIADDLDKHDDITVAVLILCRDFYDNRTMYVEKNNVNQVVIKILSMHSTNSTAT